MQMQHYLASIHIGLQANKQKILFLNTNVKMENKFFQSATYDISKTSIPMSKFKEWLIRT